MRDDQEEPDQRENGDHVAFGEANALPPHRPAIAIAINNSGRES